MSWMLWISWVCARVTKCSFTYCFQWSRLIGGIGNSTASQPAPYRSSEQRLGRFRRAKEQLQVSLSQLLYRLQLLTETAAECTQEQEAIYRYSRCRKCSNLPRKPKAHLTRGNPVTCSPSLHRPCCEISSLQHGRPCCSFVLQRWSDPWRIRLFQHTHRQRRRRLFGGCWFCQCLDHFYWCDIFIWFDPREFSDGRCHCRDPVWYCCQAEATAWSSPRMVQTIYSRCKKPLRIFSRRPQRI